MPRPATTAAGAFSIFAPIAVPRCSPTTLVGLQALKDHLSKTGATPFCWTFIPDFLTPGAVDGFIAGRAAEIAAAHQETAKAVDAMIHSRKNPEPTLVAAEMKAAEAVITTARAAD
jgi:hypothetical protein